MAQFEPRDEAGRQDLAFFADQLIRLHPDGFCVFTAEGQYLLANDALCRMLGYSRDELIGLVPPFPYWPPEEVGRINEGFSKTVRGESHTYETFFRRKNGERFPALVSSSKIVDELGHIQCVFATIRDITELKDVEGQLKALNETLEQRVAERTAESKWRANQLQKLHIQMAHVEERERRRLANKLHDGLQQTLAAASLRLGVAARQLKDHAAAKSIQEANGLLGQAIQESRSLTGELSPTVLYEAGLGAAIRWLAQDVTQKHELPVTVDLAIEAEPENLIAKVLLFQAARELLVNAIKHAQASGIYVTLAAYDADHLEVSVVDDGVGFDPDSAMGTETSPTFGLFSIRERLGAIGGRLVIDSRSHAGTVASLIVPFKPAAPLKRLATAGVIPETRLDMTPGPGDRVRILLVDDHLLVRQGIAELLSEHPDINVVGEASNGQEAVEKACELRPDVVLMDVTMPVMDGIEATRRIKLATPQIQVIGFTMHDKNEVTDRLRAAGATEVFTKTAAIETLLDAILRLGLRR